MREMSLVGRVGRRRWRARLAMVFLYLFLIVGAVTTAYPFLLMAMTGAKDLADQNDNRLIPKFFGDRQELLRKYRLDKYSGNLSMLASNTVGESASREQIASYNRFLESLPLDEWLAGFRTQPTGVTSRLTIRYQQWLMRRYPSIQALNDAYIEENVAFQTVSPPTELLEQKAWKPNLGKKWSDWLLFKAKLPAEWRIPVREARLVQEFLRVKYSNHLDNLPMDLRGTAATFEEIRVPANAPLMAEFRVRAQPDQFRRTGSIESRWGATPMPIAAAEAAFVAENSATIRQELATRNYRYVLDYMAINGRALLNTMIFCGLVILGQLTVNPLAAYALSRFPIPATGKILVFLLATMAFPAEVAMIPSFLLLKDLHLLNTFAALVLPSIASGYMIFLLKGFFDSLPSELFEAAQIDGAKETTMMMKIAFPLSKPVFGYLALLAYMGSYSAFMYAFLVAQDQRMWTLMVWIYQLNLVAPKAVIMAGLTLTTLPTLLVFLFAQRVIMRGIVLPGER